MSGQLSAQSQHDNSSVISSGGSLSDQAYRLLERQIVTLQLEPGSVINERALIELTGMGRTPVREAIQRLAWEGLMEVRPRSGIAITALNPKDFSKVLDAREGVEQVLCRDAARYSGTIEHEQLHAAAKIMKQAERAHDIPLFLDADKAFDEVLGKASGNAYATRLAAPLQTHSRRFWYQLRREHGLEEPSSTHTRMIEAIVSRDENAAIASSKALIAYLRTLTP
ncbi:GntR family transcriptional regulator [Pseudochrobactrum sp. MP213Fo]|uniref:GntR family transcriptional regulator n=1 Tax=Pseudochrobactrum sp. MP213Fo TaxID=3022250 RepID=UPI003BA19F33